MTVVLLAVVVALMLLVGWLLRPGPVRGGTMDLTAAAARGELDMLRPPSADGP